MKPWCAGAVGSSGGASGRAVLSSGVSNRKSATRKLGARAVPWTSGVVTSTGAEDDFWAAAAAESKVTSKPAKVDWRRRIDESFKVLGSWGAYFSTRIAPL